jgi:hypothetical protein
VDFSMTEQQKYLRNKIIEFAEQELNNDVIARDKNQVFPLELWRECARIHAEALRNG